MLQKYIHSFTCPKTRLDLNDHGNKKDILQFSLFFCLSANLFPEDILFSLAASQPTHSYVSFHSVHRLKHIYRNPAYLPATDYHLHPTF